MLGAPKQTCECRVQRELPAPWHRARPRGRSLSTQAQVDIAARERQRRIARRARGADPRSAPAQENALRCRVCG
jgi:hypothetical protein